MGNKKLDSSWQLLRFSLRASALEFSPEHVARVNALPIKATDPARIAPLIKGVSDVLAEEGREGEASPVVATLKKLFKPSAATRARKQLHKAFEHYARAWSAQAS